MLTILGEPVAKERPRRGPHGNFYTPPNTKAYEDLIAMIARAEKFRFGTNDIEVELDFYISPSQKRPDLDNLIKSVLDGLQKGESFRDDAQVVVLVARRFDNSKTPRVDITITEVNHDSPHL